MNKRQKELLQYQLDGEQAILKELEQQYRRALDDIMRTVRILQSDELTQSQIYQLQYQLALKGTIEATIEKLHSGEFTTIQQYLKACYTDGFIGTMYDLAGQGIPMILPIDQKTMIRAIQTESKLSTTMYDALGIDTKKLKRTIRQEITRGLAEGMATSAIARNISNASGAPLYNAKRIARTEGHRVLCSAQYDAQQESISHGADVVKQWDSTLDGHTRPTHRMLDGQIREVDEPFEAGGKTAMYPGAFGEASEDCNCRCSSLSRARSALDEKELETLKERAEYFGLDKTEDFEEFKEKYLKAAEEKEEADADEMYRNQGYTHRRVAKDGHQIIDKPTYQNLTRSFVNNGGKIIRGQAAADHLGDTHFASYLPSLNAAFIRDDATVSDVLEEMYHALQDRTNMFGDVLTQEVYLRREIAAQEYLISMTDRYKIPLEEVAVTEQNLKQYRLELEKLLNEGVNANESNV